MADHVPEKFYLTTPIYYVNARPHIGHAYSTIVADVLARRHRLLGDDVFFLTGTDEHGQKIERAAAAKGVPPQEFADGVSKTFSDLWVRMGIKPSRFIRTTDPEHVRGVQKLFRDLYEAGHIYLSTYTGQYSIGEEMFVDGPPGTIGPDGRPTETVTEENFFFKLSAFQRQLIDLISSNMLKITPVSSRNEVLNFITGDISEARQPWMEAGITGDITTFFALIDEEAIKAKKLARTAGGVLYVPDALRDLSVSRSSFTWGIPVPERVQREAGATQKHVVYVWLDALANYMTAVGYGDPAKEAEFAKWWPADLHLVGKEITRFHCVYWPAFLLALNPDSSGSTRPVPWATAAAEVSGEEHGLPPVEASAGLSGKLEGQQIPFENDSQISKGNDKDGGWVERWLPKQVTANGWLLFDNSKMSKSKGNVVRTETILEGFGEHVYGKQFPESSKEERDLFASDVLRYYLLREIPFGQDGSFSFESIVTRYNADLANGYGNLVSRTLSLVIQSVGEYIPTHEAWGSVVIQIIEGRMMTSFSGHPRDNGPFIRTPDLELARIAAVVSYFYQKAIAACRFSMAMAFDPLTSSLRANPVDGQIKVEELQYGALDYVALLIGKTDEFLSEKKPWKLARLRDPESIRELSNILYIASESIRIITVLLNPFLPGATTKVWKQLGIETPIKHALLEGEPHNFEWGALEPGTKLGSIAPIFPRADKSLAATLQEFEVASQDQSKTKVQTMPTEDTSQQPAIAETHPAAPLKGATTPAPAHDVAEDPTHPAAPPRTSSLEVENPGGHVGGSHAVTTEREGTPPHQEAAASGIFAQTAGSDGGETAQIGIEDFAKVDLRVAKIVVAERIPKADKLMRLEVDLGYEQRQILSGIAEWYTPEELVGRKIVIIANLAPRKMRGLESRGMLLAASEGEGGKPVLATFGEEIAVGTRLR